MPLTIKRTNIVTAAANSVQFNGSNQYLSLASNSAFNFGTGNYTVEGWFYWTSVPANARPFTNGQSAGSFQFYWDGGTYTSNKLTISNRIANQLQVSFLPVVNTWYHIAAVRNSGTVAIYVNGTSLGSIADNNNYSTSAVFNIGGDVGNGGTWFFPGYISNVRVVNGTAIYTASFTPSTSPLTAISGTSLLTCQSPTIIDNSTNNFTITNNNAATVSSTTPFAAASPTNNFQFVNRNNLPIVLAGTQKAIFGYGYNGATYYSMTNLVSNTGVVSTDTTGVGTMRTDLAAAGYGSDKAIFGYGSTGTVTAITNKVSNTGTVATDTTGVGTARNYLAAAGYGTDKALFGYGSAAGGDVYIVSITNLVSNTGVVATDTTGVGTARNYLAAAGYGSDKAIFGYGYASATYLSITNKVSNTGVVATDTTGVGTIRGNLAAAGYGSDKAIFGYGYASNGAGVSITNLVSNTGVVATDTTGVGTIRGNLAAAGYGSDKAIFGYGVNFGNYSMTNLVSNTGVVATDTTGVGTARQGLAAAGFSITTIPAPSGMSLKKVFADPVTIVTSGLVLNLDASNASSYPGSGTTWNDLSGNNNNGTLYNGPTFNSANGGSIVFDGVNDYVDLGNISQLKPTTQITVSAWVYRSTMNDSQNEVIIGCTQVGGYELYYTTNKMTFYVYAGGSYRIPEMSTSAISGWMNFTATYDNRDAKLYYNGVLQNTVDSGATNNISYVANNILIGAEAGTGSTRDSGFEWTGNIAQTLIYNRALTASEVLQNYNATRARFGL